MVRPVVVLALALTLLGADTITATEPPGLQPILVSLRIDDFVPEGKLSSRGVAAQRERIKGLQESVGKRHFAPGEAFEIHYYKTVPAMSLRATPGRRCVPGCGSGGASDDGRELRVRCRHVVRRSSRRRGLCHSETACAERHCGHDQEPPSSDRRSDHRSAQRGDGPANRHRLRTGEPRHDSSGSACEFHCDRLCCRGGSAVGGVRELRCGSIQRLPARRYGCAVQQDRLDGIAVLYRL